MASVELWTFEDAVEHVLDVFDLDNSTRNKRLARRSVLQAYRDIPNCRSWAYYYRRRTFATSASYATGTVTYVHTGGTYERQLTLASGTWPTWAARGKVIIANVHYDVEDYKTTTVITLTANSNPGANVAALTAFTIYRSSYTLPADFRKLTRLIDTQQNTEIRVVTPDELYALEGRAWREPGTPLLAAIKNDGDYYGNLSLTFTPPSNTAISYDLMYEAKPRDLYTEQYSTGTVSCSAASTSVTGSSTVFASTHVGAIIRFSADAVSLPTSLVGVRGDNAPLLNPFTAQRVIQAVTTTTALTIDAALPAAASGVKYTISDPIDLEAAAMLTAFWRAAELEMAKLITRTDVPMREQLARTALIRAMESDERQPPTRYSTPYGYAIPQITS